MNTVLDPVCQGAISQYSTQTKRQRRRKDRRDECRDRRERRRNNEVGTQDFS